MPTSRQRLRAVPLVGLLAVSLAACGSTVQQTGQAQLAGGGGSGGLTSGDGLGGGAAAGGTSLPADAGPDAVNGVTGPTGTTSGSTGGSASGAGSTVAGAPAAGTGGSAASAPGGAAVTSPIIVGFVTVDYAKAISQAGGDGNTGDRNADAIFKNYVQAFNAAGGLAGRRIKPLYYVVDGSSSNYDAGFEAACSYFTQDNKVEMVATAGVVNLNFSACLAKHNVPDYNANSWTLPKAVLAKTPGYFGPVGVSHERAAASLVDLALRQGWFKKGEKIGIVVDGCPEHEATAKQIVEPRLHKAGIESVTVVPYSCFRGFSSLGEMSAGMQNAVLRFRQEGVTTVMYVTYVENIAHLSFVHEADSQQYVPKYVVNSTTFLAALAPDMPERQAAGMHGVGWQPVIDLWVFPAAKSPARTACLDLLKKGDVQPPKNIGELFAMFSICDVMRLMDAQLTATKGSARISALFATGSALKSSYTSAIGWGPADMTDGQGPELVEPFTYHPDCKCVRFDGKPVPLARA